MTQLATFARDGAIGLIELRSPRNGNAIGLELARQLKEAVQACVADTGVRAVLVAAEGANFCVGGDIATLAAPADDRAAGIRAITSDFHAAIELLLACPRPIVTAVQGSAAGAGLSLALCGDVVFAAADATFVPAFTAIGLSADGGTTWLLPRLVGARRAAELLITNRRLDAGEAEQWGLVSHVCETEPVRDPAYEMTQKLAGGPTAAFATVKHLLRQSPHTGFRDQVAEEAAMIAAHAAGRDGEEGIAAFRARRRPSFTGEGALSGA